MINKKIWLKDKKFQFKPGDIVKLARKKNNGYPRFIYFDKIYQVIKISNEDIIIFNIEKKEQEFKINKNYIVPVKDLRNKLIDDILN